MLRCNSRGGDIMKKGNSEYLYYIVVFYSIILLFLSLYTIKLTSLKISKSENDITLTVLSIRNDDLY